MFENLKTNVAKLRFVDILLNSTTTTTTNEDEQNVSIPEEEILHVFSLLLEKVVFRFDAKNLFIIFRTRKSSKTTMRKRSFVCGTRWISFKQFCAFLSNWTNWMRRCRWTMKIRTRRRFWTRKLSTSFIWVCFVGRGNKEHWTCWKAFICCFRHKRLPFNSRASKLNLKQFKEQFIYEQNPANKSEW